MGRSSGAVVLVGSLLGAALGCVAGCASVTGLDEIEECDTCFEGGATQDGTVSADAAPDATSGNDASADTWADASTDSTGDAGVADTGPARDGTTGDAARDAPQDATDAGDALPADAQGDGADATGPCNPTSCVGGCCQGVNCVAGTQDDACGQTGASCLNCASLGDTCVAGACQAPNPNCPTTCSGCCDTNNACHPTPSPQDCPTAEGGVFKAGLPCEDCVSEGYNFCVHDIVAYVCAPIP